MKTILILRHAKSDWGDVNLSDFDRPLTERGLTDAPRMGEVLALYGLLPDKILSSPAKRAKQTAELVAKACGYAKKLIQWEDSFYGGSQNDLIGALKRLPDDLNRVLLIGHNPTMESIVARLCTFGGTPSAWGDMGGGLSMSIPTAGLVCLEADVQHWSEINMGNAALRWFIEPKLVKALMRSEE